MYKTIQCRPEDLVDNLSGYNLQDENGEDNLLFNEHGQQIPRYHATYLGQPRCCGLLQNLSDLDALFDDDDLESADEVDDMLDIEDDNGHINDEDEAGRYDGSAISSFFELAKRPGKLSYRTQHF